MWAALNNIVVGYNQKLRKQNNLQSNGQISADVKSPSTTESNDLYENPSSYFKFASIIKSHKFPLSFGFPWRCFEMVFLWNIWTLIAISSAYKYAQYHS